MPTYLIDVNLPYYFSLWHSDEYIHQIDLQNDSEDYEIWQRGMTIITKDADFSDRILLSEPPPRVIHIRIGNASMRDFHRSIDGIWRDVLAMSREYKLVIVFKDKIEAIN